MRRNTNKRAKPDPSQTLTLAEKIGLDVPISPREAGVMTGRSLSTIYKWIAEGKLPRSRKHGSLLLPSLIRQAIARSSARA